jgi:hypothetical protein
VTVHTIGLKGWISMAKADCVSRTESHASKGGAEDELHCLSGMALYSTLSNPIFRPTLSDLESEYLNTNNYCCAFAPIRTSKYRVNLRATLANYC